MKKKPYVYNAMKMFFCVWSKVILFVHYAYIKANGAILAKFAFHTKLSPGFFCGLWDGHVIRVSFHSVGWKSKIAWWCVKVVNHHAKWLLKSIWEMDICDLGIPLHRMETELEIVFEELACSSMRQGAAAAPSRSGWSRVIKNSKILITSSVDVITG